MHIKRRIELFKKLSQVAAPSASTAPAPATTTIPASVGILNSAATNLESYFGVLQSIIPNLNIVLLSPADWIHCARIIGVIDMVLVTLSGKRFNFRFVTTSAPSTESNDVLNSLISSAQNLKAKLTATQKIQYTPQQIRALITDPLRKLSTKLDNIGMSASMNVGATGGSPGESLRREISSWSK